jgi:hypothetical protein
MIMRTCSGSLAVLRRGAWAHRSDLRGPAGAGPLSLAEQLVLALSRRALLENEGKYDTDDEEARNRVHDDPDPGALEPLGGIGLINDPVDHAGRHAPWLVQVVEPEEGSVRDEIALSKAARMRVSSGPAQLDPELDPEAP